jgi:hypothetical protein
MKYLFRVKFADGQIYEQSPDDLSKLEPTRSSFYDILQQEQAGNPPVTFQLFNGQDYYAVDLIDGHFEVNGAKLWLHEPVSNLKLIYFRTVDAFFSMGASTSQQIKNYTFGWQVRGTDLQKILILN